jgi:Ca2+-binding RTX toxin-like protein
MSKPVATVPQLADYLINGFWQDNGEIAHHWGSTTITYNISALNAAEQTLALAALNAWHEVANLTFVQTSGAANITYNHNGSMTAFENDFYTGAGIITSATIDISADWVTSDGGAYDGKTGIDSYAYQTYIHETGHALGLGHQGNYNGSASYSADATYADDTWQYSIMSYFSEQNYNGGSYRYVITPQMADIYAVQSVYGAAATRTGDTVYGFHNTAGSIFNFSSYTQAPALTIYDSGGTDTLDCSGYSVAQTIDLHSGSFSSVGGLVHNIGIATSAVIECAIGGSAGDTLIANDGGCTLNGMGGNDTLTGGAGNDILIGGAGNNTINGAGGTDTLDYSANTGVEVINVYSGTAQNGLGGTDTFSNVENFLMGSANDTIYGGAGSHFFSGGGGLNIIDYAYATSTVTLDLTFGRVFNGWGGIDMMANFYAFRGGSGNDVLLGGPGSVILDGAGGANIVDYTNAPGAVTFDMAHGIFHNGFGGTDQLANFATFKGSANNDTFIMPPGSITVDGGNGVDTLDYSQEPGTETVNVFLGTANNGYGGTDNFSNFENIYTGGGNDTIIGGAGSHFYNGGGGNNTIDYSNATSAVIIDLANGTVQNGWGGTDTMASFATFKGGSGNDTLLGGPGSVTLDGGGGLNILDYSNAPGSVTFDMMHGLFLNGFGGSDHLANFATFRGSANADTFIMPPGSITVDGGGGTDTLDYSQQSGVVNVDLSTGIAHNGFGGTDHLSNFEIVKTGAGDDTLTGQAGSSTLFGGAGNNTFVFRDGFGATTIGDFTNSTGNILDLSGVSAFNTFADVQSHWTQSGSDVHIADPAGGSVTIDNVTLAYLQAHQSEFIV